MKAVVLNTMSCILGLANHHVLLRCVQHVGHTLALQVGDVTDCLAITNHDTSAHLEVMVYEYSLVE